MRKLLLALAALCLPGLAMASELDGSQLALSWGIPFAGILLSIALAPLIIPRIWHHHYGKITFGWVLLFLVPFWHTFGWQPTVDTIAHALIGEFIPFILLLLALFTISGGILITGNLQGTPKLNLLLLLIGTMLSSVMGTTGAAMLLIRPLIRANDNRRHCAHTIIFFIFLVANIGGSLTPLGDPPLFIGFLKGVDFFWTTQHLFLPMVTVSGLLLLIYYLLDSYYYRQEDEQLPRDPTPTNNRLKLYGKANIVLLLLTIAVVLLCGMWQSSQVITILNVPVTLPNLLRDLLLLLITVISIKITPKQVRAGNQFDFEPIIEVAKLFAGIFITIVPVLAILRAGYAGAMAPIVHLVTDSAGNPINSMYFWLSGVLSGFLDNAPTYLVFFNLADGDAQQMMGPLGDTLRAISMGSVFMGALTYIGNAPNFMVRSIAVQREIKMPGFFGYMKWSVLVLVPLFVLLTFLYT